MPVENQNMDVHVVHVHVLYHKEVLYFNQVAFWGGGGGGEGGEVRGLWEGGGELEGNGG